MLIILDRDGVINVDSHQYIKTPDEWIAIPGSLEAIAKLNRAGFRVVVASNQSGLARGLYTVDLLNQIHEKFHRELAAVGGHVEEIFYCPHHPDEKCECRKPEAGLFYQIQKKYNINLTETFFIGDRLSDVQVAKKVGCIPILVLTGNGQKTLEQNPLLSEILHFPDLARATEYLLKNTSSP